MKAILLNGSPNERGNTWHGLREAEKSLEAAGIETELMWIGKSAIKGCVACNECANRPGKCIFDNDIVNEFLRKAKDADGFVFGSPVYWASPNASLLAAMDRIFYAGGGYFRGKPGSAIVAVRRAGGTASLDVLQKYFIINGMPIVPSQYWPMVYGAAPGECEGDLEGMQTARLAGAYLAWMIKSFDLARRSGIEMPKLEEREWTNFIR
jgi:multimeric flavodoxin WrbA